MASTITTSVVTGGTNSHATTVAEVNAFRSDFAGPGCVGILTNTSGVAPSTGAFAVNAQASPAMFVDVTAGSAYITATPAGQVSQVLRANMTATYTSYAISANASGSTKFDWIYLSVDATKANNPASDASDVTSLFTSRSSSNTSDNGSPPTYGQLLAVVTVANGASSISNSNIADSRTRASISAATNYNFLYDFVESTSPLGCVWTADSAGATLNASMSSGFIWLSGVRLSVAGVTSRAFTASRDTYVDLSNNGDGTAAFTYTAVTNNAASPALSAGALRVAIVVTGASNIAAATSINQGQESRILPIASSIPYAVTDSIGNLICPRDPQRRLIGMRFITSNFTTTTTASQVDVTGVSMNVIIPPGRKIQAIVTAPECKSTESAGNGIYAYAVDATASANFGNSHIDQAVTAYSDNLSFTTVPYTPATSGTRNFKLQAKEDAAGTLTFTASATNPVGLAIYLI